MTLSHRPDKVSHSLIETLKVLPLLERNRIESNQNAGVKDSAILFKLFLGFLYQRLFSDGSDAFADSL